MRTQDEFIRILVGIFFAAVALSVICLEFGFSSSLSAALLSIGLGIPLSLLLRKELIRQELRSYLSVLGIVIPVGLLFGVGLYILGRK
jgi:hypothetical protein